MVFEVIARSRGFVLTYVNSSLSSVDGEKLVSCCKTVSRTEVTDPITGYWIQNYNAPCVRTVM